MGQVEVVVVTAGLAGHADAGLVDPVAVVDHHAVIATVDHEDVAFNRADGDGSGTGKLVVTSAGPTAEGGRVGAVDAENLDSIVGGIWRIDAPRRIHGQVALYPGPPVAKVGVVVAVHPGLLDRPLLDSRCVQFDQPEAPVFRHVETAIGATAIPQGLFRRTVSGA